VTRMSGCVTRKSGCGTRSGCGCRVVDRLVGGSRDHSSAKRRPRDCSYQNDDNRYAATTTNAKCRRTLVKPAAMKDSLNHFVRDAVYADWVSARRISCGSTSGNRATMSSSSCRDDQPRALAASRRHPREGVGEQRVFALSFPGAPLSGAQGSHSDALGDAPVVIVSSSHFARRSCNRLLPTEYRSSVPCRIE